MKGDRAGRPQGSVEPGFTLSLDHARRLLWITFRGQWTLLTVATYRLARSRALREAEAAGVPRGQLVILVDRRDQPVQIQEVVAAISEVTADNSRYARRTAVIVTSALHARQIRRTAPTPAMGIFETEDEALSWLLAD